MFDWLLLRLLTIVWSYFDVFFLSLFVYRLYELRYDYEYESIHRVFLSATTCFCVGCLDSLCECLHLFLII